MEKMKRQISYIGKMIFTEKEITNENKFKKRYNGNPIYWKVPFEITAPSVEMCKSTLLKHDICDEFPSQIFNTNIVISQRKIKDFLVDYLHGVVKLMHTEIYEVE